MVYFTDYRYRSFESSFYDAMAFEVLSPKLTQRTLTEEEPSHSHRCKDSNLLRAIKMDFAYRVLHTYVHNLVLSLQALSVMFMFRTAICRWHSDTTSTCFL